MKLLKLQNKCINSKTLIAVCCYFFASQVVYAVDRTNSATGLTNQSKIEKLINEENSFGKIPNSPWIQNQNQVQALATYSVSSTDLKQDTFSQTFVEYFFNGNDNDTSNKLWQAQIGLFVVDKQTSAHQNIANIESQRAINVKEVNLGFRWGALNLSNDNAIESYSVLLGYGLADKVELNLGFSMLDIDEGIYQSSFYEGTWYAGFSAKF